MSECEHSFTSIMRRCTKCGIDEAATVCDENCDCGVGECKSTPLPNLKDIREAILKMSQKDLVAIGFTPSPLLPLDAETIRKWWRFDDKQQPLSSWHEREDFIQKYGTRPAVTKEQIKKVIDDWKSCKWDEKGNHCDRCGICEEGRKKLASFILSAIGAA